VSHVVAAQHLFERATDDRPGAADVAEDLAGRHAVGADPRAGDGAGIAEAPYRRRPPWRGGGAAIESRYKAKPDAAKGMMRITRHPFLWGAAIWALGHMIANGRAADLVLFGDILALSILGAMSIDAKRQRALGQRYTVFKTKSSNIPFATIAQGRQSFNIGEIWWRLVLALLVWGALVVLHPMLFGVRPLG